MIKNRVSIIIPSNNEIFLSKTIQDLLSKATGDIEIIAVLDGGLWPTEQKREFWSTPAIITDPRVHYLYRGKKYGMRDGINTGVAVATGEYIMKSDGHCMYGVGFDEILKADIEDNWIVIPRRKRLDAEKWEIQDVGKPDVDYEYIGSPADDGAKGSIWTARITERLNDPKYDIDENMTFQGSCWFMKLPHYVDFLKGMSEQGYGSFVREAQEIGLKTWLGGGKVMTNKKTWYAHLHKGKTYGRGYFLNSKEVDIGNKYCDDFWFNNRWPKSEGRVHTLGWLIERFGGVNVPTWSEELIKKVS